MFALVTLAFTNKCMHGKSGESVYICKSYSEKSVTPFYADTVYKALATTKIRCAIRTSPRLSRMWFSYRQKSLIRGELCLEVKREYYQNCSVLGCVTPRSQSAAHLDEQLLQVQQIGFVTLGRLRCVYCRGGCLELYYCNIVEWCRWDSGLIWNTNWFPSVLWHCWFGHMTCNNRPRNDL